MPQPLRAFLLPFVLGLFASLGVVAHDARAAVPADAVAPVERLHQGLLAAMKGGKSLGVEGRRQQLDPIVRGAFDFPYMVRTVTGRYWERMSEAERTQITAAFSRMSVGTYASRFDDYNGERFEITDRQPGPRDTVWVQTRLVPTGDKPVSLNYLLRQSADDGWRIIDVYLDGTVSELATRRAEYASVLSRSGVSGLIAELERKANENTAVN